MSSAVVTGVVDQLREFGETRRGWLGVRIQPVDEAVAEAIGLEDVRGALVADVPPGPAAEGGIEAGDVILSFDGQQIDEMRELPRVVAATQVGKAVRVIVFRDGRTRTLLVTLGRLEDTSTVEADSEGQNGKTTQPEQAEIAGMTLSGITAQMREQYDIPDSVDGVVVTAVDELSDAYERGMRPGQVIAEVGQRTVAAPSDVVAIIEEVQAAGRKSVLMLVRDGGEPRFVALDLDQ